MPLPSSQISSARNNLWTSAEVGLIKPVNPDLKIAIVQTSPPPAASPPASTPASTPNTPASTPRTQTSTPRSAANTPGAPVLPESTPSPPVTPPPEVSPLREATHVGRTQIQTVQVQQQVQLPLTQCQQQVQSDPVVQQPQESEVDDVKPLQIPPVLVQQVLPASVQSPQTTEYLPPAITEPKQRRNKRIASDSSDVLRKRKKSSSGKQSKAKGTLLSQPFSLLRNSGVLISLFVNIQYYMNSFDKVHCS